MCGGKRFTVTILWLMLVGIVFGSQSFAIEGRSFFVAPNGSDSDPGTLKQPWHSLQYAVSHLQAGDTCYLRCGHYHESVKIADLQGEMNRPIIMCSYQNEVVVLDGTVPIQGKWFHYKDGVYHTQQTQPIWQLFVNGKSACSARWPNGNWDDGSIWDKQTSMAWPESNGSAFGRHINQDLSLFKFSLKGAIVIVNAGSFRTYASWITQHTVGSNTLAYDTSLIRERKGYPVTRQGYFLEGKLGFLDADNEWFYDLSNQRLYYKPPKGQTPDDLEFRGKVQSYAIDVHDSSHIQFQGLTFLGTTFRFEQSQHCLVENCNLSYPSFSRRMLQDLSPVAITHMTVRDEFDSAHNTVRNCVIAYTDGPALEMNGVGCVVENNYIHNIDFSCTYKGGWTLNMINAPELVFRRNTVHTTGASELFKSGRQNLIELNDLSRSGYLQNDGALIQISVKQQQGTIVRYNWIHDSSKIGLRFDNMNIPSSPWGQGCRAHHNVAWRTQRVFFKGDNHFIHNNLCFDSKQNDLIISSDIETNGRNFETVTRNNIVGTLSGSRTKSGKEFPVPGTVENNWSSDVTGQDIRTQLRDPNNLDFRPRRQSDLVDAGKIMEGYTFPFQGKAPDIGPYEFGDLHYWIPGRQWPQATQPIPLDGAIQVPCNAELMWLAGYKADAHRVFWGTSRMQLKEHIQHKGNIFSSGAFLPNTAYYWRVDAVQSDKTIPGQVWSFTTVSE